MRGGGRLIWVVVTAALFCLACSDAWAPPSGPTKGAKKSPTGQEADSDNPKNSGKKGGQEGDKGQEGGDKGNKEEVDTSSSEQSGTGTIIFVVIIVGFALGIGGYTWFLRRKARKPGSKGKPKQKSSTGEESQEHSPQQKTSQDPEESPDNSAQASDEKTAQVQPDQQEVGSMTGGSGSQGGEKTPHTDYTHRPVEDRRHGRQTLDEARDGHMSGGDVPGPSAARPKTNERREAFMANERRKSQQRNQGFQGHSQLSEDEDWEPSGFEEDDQFSPPPPVQQYPQGQQYSPEQHQQSAPRISRGQPSNQHQQQNQGQHQFLGQQQNQGQLSSQGQQQAQDPRISQGRHASQGHAGAVQDQSGASAEEVGRLEQAIRGLMTQQAGLDEKILKITKNMVDAENYDELVTYVDSIVDSIRSANNLVNTQVLKVADEQYKLVTQTEQLFTNPVLQKVMGALEVLQRELGMDPAALQDLNEVINAQWGPVVDFQEAKSSLTESTAMNTVEIDEKDPMASLVQNILVLQSSWQLRLDVEQLRARAASLGDYRPSFRALRELSQAFFRARDRMGFALTPEIRQALEELSSACSMGIILPGEGEKMNPKLHEPKKTQSSTHRPGTVLDIYRPGFISVEGEVQEKAQVVVPV